MVTVNCLLGITDFAEIEIGAYLTMVTFSFDRVLGLALITKK